MRIPVLALLVLGLLAEDAQAFTVGYRLVNATTLEDLGPLTNGAVIPAALSCVAIRIEPSIPIGSLAKTLDAPAGSTPTSANAPENSAAYGWPDGSNAAPWPCANFAIGSHILRVRAWANASGGGAVLGDSSLTFSVGTVVKCP